MGTFDALSWPVTVTVTVSSVISTAKIQLGFAFQYKSPPFGSTLSGAVSGLFASDSFVGDKRATTEREIAVGDLRRWESFNDNWDGENSAASNLYSLRSASQFLCHMPADSMVP